MNKIKQKLALIFIIILYIIIQFTIPSNATTGTILSTSIRLRKEPSTSSEILETILKGEKVEIISEENGWYKAKYGKLNGYLSKEYVKVDGDVINEGETEPKQDDDNKNNPNTTTPVSTEPEEDTKPVNNQEKSIYILPLINSTVIYKVKTEDTKNILQTINNWQYVEVNGIRGWECTEILTKQTEIESDTSQVSTEPNEDEAQDNTIKNTISQDTQTNTTEPTSKEAYISVEQVNFRKEASMESTVLDTLPRNTKVELLDKKGEWSKVKHNGKEGYIATRYLSDTKVEVTTRSSEPRTSETFEENTTQTVSNNTNTDTKKQELVNYAKQFLGSKYVHGGASPSGFDCSGFTYYVYKHFGYKLSRASSAQVNNGTTISKSDLQLGDLIFFSHYKTFQGIGHVGIYIGNNQFIHASSEKTGVIITSLSSGNYPKRYVTAKRIF